MSLFGPVSPFSCRVRVRGKRAPRYSAEHTHTHSVADMEKWQMKTYGEQILILEAVWGAAVIGPRGGRRPPHYFDFISASAVMEWCSWLELTGSKQDRINRNVRHGKALTFGDREIDCCWTVSLLGGKVRFNSENVPGKHELPATLMRTAEKCSQLSQMQVQTQLYLHQIWVIPLVN